MEEYKIFISVVQSAIWWHSAPNISEKEKETNLENGSDMKRRTVAMEVEKKRANVKSEGELEREEKG